MLIDFILIKSSTYKCKPYRAKLLGVIILWATIFEEIISQIHCTCHTNHLLWASHTCLASWSNMHCTIILLCIQARSCQRYLPGESSLQIRQLSPGMLSIDALAVRANCVLLKIIVEIFSLMSEVYKFHKIKDFVLYSMYFLHFCTCACSYWQNCVDIIYTALPGVGT